MFHITYLSKSFVEVVRLDFNSHGDILGHPTLSALAFVQSTGSGRVKVGFVLPSQFCHYFHGTYFEKVFHKEEKLGHKRRKPNPAIARDKR